MSRRVLISFGSELYQPGMKRLLASGAKYFDDAMGYRPEHLTGCFRDQYGDVLKDRRGFGYWAWKPYIILRTLQGLSAGDCVMYCDALMRFVSDPSCLFGICHELGGVLLFHQRREKHANAMWTKGDCFALMNCNEPTYWGGDNLVAAFQVYEHRPQAFDFLFELLDWCGQRQVISDDPDRVARARPEFKAHRHDQSITSLMAIQRGLPTCRDISQWGNGYKDTTSPYGQIVHHHRNLCG